MSKVFKSKISTWWMAIFGAVFWVHIVDPYNTSCNHSGFVLQLRWRRLMEPKNLLRRKKRCDFWTFIEFILKLKATPFHSFKIKCFASILWRWLIFIRWKNFFETCPPPHLRFWMTPLPPYLKVWIRHCGVRLVCYTAVFSVITQCPSPPLKGRLSD